MGTQTALKPFDWSSTLTKHSKELLSLASRTEEEFLALGEQIQNFHEENRDHLKQAKALIQAMENGKLLDLSPFREMAALFEKLDFTELSQEINDRLQKLGRKISESDRLCAVLDSTCQGVRAISLLMKIESSRLTETNFDSVIADLKSLNQKMIDNYKQVVRLTHGIRDDIKRLTEKLAKNQYHRSKQEQQLKLESGKTLHDLEKLQAKIFHFTEEMHDLTTKVEKEISEMVAAMQFHDISRQRMEHIAEGFQKICQDLDSMETPDAEESHAVLYRAIKILELEIAQVEDVLTLSQETTQNLSRHFEKVGNLLKQQLQISNTTQDQMGAERVLVNRLREEMESVAEQLQNEGEVAGVVVKSITGVIDQIEQVSGEVSKIEGHRRDLDLLTWNTIIRAHNCQENSTGLATLSEEITGLTKTVQKEVIASNELVKNIIESSESLNQLVSQQLEQQLSGTEKGQKQVQNIIEILVSDLEQFKSSINGSQTLHHSYQNTTVHLSFEADFQHSLKTCKSEVLAIKQQLQTLLPPDYEVLHGNSLDIEALKQKYTMQSERDVHNKVLSEETESVDSEFEDNVELF